MTRVLGWTWFLLVLKIGKNKEIIKVGTISVKCDILTVYEE